MPSTLLAASEAPSFVVDLAIVLAVAALTSLGFRLLKQPPLLGYLLAGVVIGPYTPIPLFADAEQVHAMSEFGVVLVMFGVGLEFSLDRFMKVLPRSGLVALIEISAMGWAGYALGQALGWTGVESLFLAGALAISSTMVVAKVFEETKPAPDVRELVFGVLVIQDVVAIALLAVLGAVAAGLGVSAEALGATLLELGLFLVALLFGGLLIVPRLVRLVERVGSPETRVVAAGGLCFGLALLAQSFGYSIALGAFVAGMLVAESGKGHEVDHLIQPVRDLFVAVFFVSIGMSVDPLLVWANLGATLVILVVVVVGQLVVVTLGSLLGGNGLRRSLEAGLSLGQLGEFAFIMAGIGVAHGVVGDQLVPVLVAVAIATTFTTPLLVRRADAIITWFDRRLPARIRSLMSLYEAWFESLIQQGAGDKSRLRRSLGVLAADALGLIGVAVVGAMLREPATWLVSDLGLAPWMIRIGYELLILLALSPFAFGLARAARRLAQLLGDQLLPGGREGRPDLANAPRRTLVVVVQLAVVVVIGAPVLLVTQPFVQGPSSALVLGAVMLGMLMVLWRDSGNLDGHLQAGAQVVLALLRQSPEASVVAAEVGEVEGDPSESQISPQQLDAEVAALLPGIGHVEGVPLASGAPAIGRSLAELDLHVQTGAVVLAIARTGGDLIRPEVDVRLREGDVVAVMGCTDAVSAARALLAG
ncbi:cation:proton antiporter [Nannocystaceae bacterium ST9]